jgi:hypothetical protein
MTIPTLPDSEKVQKTVSDLRKVCRQFDALNSTLEELMIQVEVEIQNSPLAASRLNDGACDKEPV